MQQVATGRAPRVDGLGLERIGVALTPHGITVHEDLRTSLRHVFAAGDVTGGAQFTHYAVWQGDAAARRRTARSRPRSSWRSPQSAADGPRHGASRHQTWSARTSAPVRAASSAAAPTAVLEPAPSAAATRMRSNVPTAGPTMGPIDGCVP
jgi:hypothetical protein